MSEFYIKKLLAKGSGKTDSFVELQPDLKLIQGCSNTGKTYIIKCIDFCFRGKNKPFDYILGYTTIELSFHKPSGNIQISSSFEKTKLVLLQIFLYTIAVPMTYKNQSQKRKNLHQY